jgi:hypothetical protein
MESRNILMYLFGTLLVFSVLMILIVNFPKSQPIVTGHVSEVSTTSNVTIVTYLAITLSTNLSGGIRFGSVSALPAGDVNATSNYDVGGTNSSYFANVSTDSNTAVDFCLKVNSDLLSSGGNVIGAGNETYANSSLSNATRPLLAQQIPLTTSYVLASLPTGQGNVTYYRFWLDVPSATVAGTYNNTIDIKGVQTTAGC